MSSFAAAKPYPEDDFEEKCPRCGVVNRVEVVKQDGHNELEDYFCAKCGMKLGVRTASLTPRTSIVNDPA